MAHIQHGTVVGLDKSGVAATEGSILAEAVSTLAVKDSSGQQIILTAVEGRINKTSDTIEVVIAQSPSDALDTAAMLVWAVIRLTSGSKAVVEAVVRDVSRRIAQKMKGGDGAP